MSLYPQIATIVSTKIPGATYVLSSWFKANRNSYDIDSMGLLNPFVVLSNEIKKNNQVQQNYNILSEERIVMRFLTNGTVYDSDTEMQAMIDAMEAYADQVFMQISLLSAVRLTGNEKAAWTITPIFKAWNSVLTGVEAEGRFKLNKVINICTDE